MRSAIAKLTAKLDGITVSVTPPSVTVDVPKWTPDGSGEVQDNRICDGFSFNMNTSKVTLLLSKSDSKLKMGNSVPRVCFHKVNWTNLAMVTPSGSVTSTTRSDHTGYAKLSLSAESTGAWKNENGTENISIKFEDAKAFNVEATNLDDPNWFERFIKGHLVGILEGMNDIKIPIPSLGNDFGTLDYFLATNLLFPGSHMFKSGKIPDDLYVPHDLLILGSIVDKDKQE